jgi:hypothetical protein
MRTLVMAAGCLIAGLATADEAVVKVYSLSVQERLETLELIDVTAEKAPAENDAPMDAELAEILNEVEALEQASGLVTD